MLRVAYFSPMPPAKSGIAEYSAALVREMSRIASVEVFADHSKKFDPARFDVALYQIGNNGDHAFAYETAMRNPGVVVLHEANLHHLIAEMTIRRGDWDAYVSTCSESGGETARAFAERVRALDVGPDYEGVAMLQPLLRSARGLITHSRFVLDRAIEAGYSGPQAVIPHGAWVNEEPGETQIENSRNAVRQRLGIDDQIPLIGAFGYLKPYKRIGPALRALRRITRLEPRVRMILCGEPHPELPIADLIRSLGLEVNVRVLGYTPIEDFDAYIRACDIVVNLRYPTVGESSGSLLRAFSFAKPALVSDIGAFSELPDDVCLKVPVDASEEDLIFEYLNLLVSRPALGRAIGESARSWVSREASWQKVARRYVDFLDEVAHPDRAPKAHAQAAVVAGAPPEPAPPPRPITIETLEKWVVDTPSRQYLQNHTSRLARTLEITPPGDASKSVLEMGSYMQITAALKSELRYGQVRGCYYGPLGRVDRKTVRAESGEEFECLIDHFDAERDRFPYDDAEFDTIVCGELIEHLASDPMHMMSEVNRILKPGGHIVLTTPNINSFRAIAAIFGGYHPGFFTAYLKPNPNGVTEARHNREYTPGEVENLFTASGFETELLETGPFRDEPHPEFHWVEAVLARLSLRTALRGDGIYAVGRKTGAVRDRWPDWLYG